MNTRIPLRGRTVPVRVSHGPCYKSTKESRRLRRFIATSKPVSPETCPEVGKRHVLDYAEHCGREEHEFCHGVRSHHQACGVPLEQIDDDLFRSGGFTHLGGVTPWCAPFVVTCAARTSG